MAASPSCSQIAHGAPRISVKALDSKRSFIGFTTTLKKKSEKKLRHNRGYFLDLKTMVYVLTSESLPLKDAAVAFGCTRTKLDPKEHGVVRPEYIDYNVNDTLLAHELYLKGVERYKLYCLNVELNKLYSPAGIAKAYMEKIGIRRFWDKNPDFPREMIGRIMMGYYGGRCEVRIRKSPCKVTYLDFTSMYPSLYAMYNMDRYLKANKITYHDTTKETQGLLNQITIEDIRNPKTWPSLITICRIKPNMDVLPVRSNYGGGTALTIGVNYLISDGPHLWYALPDIIASKFLSGKIPVIEEAFTFAPEGVQDDLIDIEVLKGIPCRKEEDFVRKLIEERIRIKTAMESAEDAEKKQMKLQQKILKIIANALYGTFIQVDTNKCKESPVNVYGLEAFETTTRKKEKEGKMFNPIISVFLTSGSRLILATAEKLVTDAGGYIAYCDTDSILISPRHEELITEFFRGLNPYNVPVPDMFKVEPDDDGKDMRDVWFYGISAKRYVIFTVKPNGEIVIGKYSSHGLGGLVNIDEKQLWKDILEIHYSPLRKEEVLRRYYGSYAVGKLNISSYEVQARFREMNKGKPYDEQIKPFNFITVGLGYKNNPETGKPINPMLPYVSKKIPGPEPGTEIDNPEFECIPYMPFRDYKTGRLYKDDDLREGQLWTKSYWEPLSLVVKDYIDHPEAKSKGDTGQLTRRVLRINHASIRYVGKETDDIEVAEIIGVGPEDYAQYVHWKGIINCLTTDVATMLGISERHLLRLKQKVRDGEPIPLRKRTKAKLLHWYNG